MTCDIAHCRSAQRGRDIVPADAPPRRMSGAVAPIARKVGQVDPAHECHLVVDDHELLVMTMERALVRVESAHDVVVLAELLPDPSHDTPRYRIERQRGAAPQEHPHPRVRGGLGEQVAKQGRSISVGQGEPRRDVPARQVHMRTGPCDRRGHPCERVLAIDEHLQGIAVTRGRRSCSPVGVGGRQRLRPPCLAQAPAMVPEHRAFERVADEAVDASTRAGTPATIPG